MPSSKPFVLPDGRGTGRIPDTSPRVSAMPRSGVELPESELKPFRDEHGIPIRDQDGRGACNAFAACRGLEYARWMAHMPHVDVSPWFPYSIMCNGVDRGSMILDALALLTTTGTCPDSMVPYGTINPRKLSAEAKQNAPRFRIEIGNRLETWKEIISAVMLRRPVNLSLRAGGGFDRLDSEGVAGAVRGVGNHAVFVGGGLMKSAKWGWCPWMDNSWTPNWANKGSAYICEAHWENQSYREAYELIAVEIDPNDPNLPPPVVL